VSGQAWIGRVTNAFGKPNRHRFSRGIVSYGRGNRNGGAKEHHQLQPATLAYPSRGSLKIHARWLHLNSAIVWGQANWKLRQAG